MQWFPGDVGMAIQVSRKNKALLVVYVSSESPDGKVFDEFWHQIDSNNLLCPVVGIKLKEGETAAKQFADIYPTPILPAAYLIDHEGKPLEVITTLVGKTYDAFRSRFDRGTASFMNAVGRSAPKESAAPATQNIEAPSQNAPSAPMAPSEPSQSAPTSSASVQNAPVSAQNSQNLTPELAEKVARAKKLLELKKQRDEQRQREADKVQREELARASEAKRDRDDKAIVEAAKQRKKEKEESMKEKDRILAQIKADREEREKRYKKSQSQASESDNVSGEKSEKKEVSVGKAIPSDRCRLQVRLPDGSTFVEEFPSNDVLNSLIAIIQQKPSISGSFEIQQTFPRRVFTVDDYSKTFLENQLTPSTALVVVLKPSTVSNISKAVSTQSSSIFSLFLSPFFMIWNIFSGMFGFSGNTESSKKNEGPSGAPQGAQGQRGMPRSAQIRRRGNVAGLENPNDDDPEERANFNGNSTQFM